MTDGAGVARRVGVGRQTLGLVIGAGLGIVIVAGVMFLVMRAGSPSPHTSAGAPEAHSTERTSARFCRELERQGYRPDDADSVAAYRQMFRRLDFDALEAAAPAELRHQLEQIDAVREEVQTALDETHGEEDLDPAKFPKVFIDAIPAASIAVESCAFSH